MTRFCKTFLIFLAAIAVSGCITIKNPFQSPGADARMAARDASGLDETRGAYARAGDAGQNERELLLRALETLTQTRRIGHAASLKRTPDARVVFDYTYFDQDLREMIKAVRAYLTAHGTDARATRAAAPLNLDYARLRRAPSRPHPSEARP